MVGGQTLAPSQCSVGLVNTIGCADGDVPGNGIPKPPRQAGRWLPSSAARDAAGETCRALTWVWKPSRLLLTLPFPLSPSRAGQGEGLPGFLQLHPRFPTARQQRSWIFPLHGHAAAPGHCSASPGWYPGLRASPSSLGSQMRWDAAASMGRLPG